MPVSYTHLDVYKRQDAEWTILENNLPSPDKGSSIAGNEPLWTNGVLDQSAFFGTADLNLLPGGIKGIAGFFFQQGSQATIWSSTEYVGTNAWTRTINYNSTDIISNDANKPFGYSVRCVQD